MTVVLAACGNSPTAGDADPTGSGTATAATASVAADERPVTTTPAAAPAEVTAASSIEREPPADSTSRRVTTVPTTTTSPGRAADETPTTQGQPTPSEHAPVQHMVPVSDPATAGWHGTHAGYPATDVFVSGGCGATVVSPVDGIVSEVRTVDSWEPAIDDPATRGGRSVAVVGHDGVRYYLAHFATIDADVVVDRSVAAGDPLGTVGASGRASACHVHFGISPPCPEPEWAVRRGVVWPAPYLDAWAAGEAASPAAEVAAWLEANPDACSDAASAGP